MPGSVFMEGEHGPPEATACVPFGDVVVGVYAAAGASDLQNVVVTEQGIVFVDGIWRRVPYARIARAHVVTTGGADKMAADKVEIVSDDGSVHVVTISGGGERYRDVFEFSRFLSRVAEIQRSPKR